MSFLAGLVWGILIAAATVALRHYGPSSEPLGINLSDSGSIAAPLILVPLAIFWGWSWLANAYSGRSAVPIAAYTVALFLGVSLIGPADALFVRQSAAELTVNDLLGGLFYGTLFVGFVAIIAAPIYWVLRSRIGHSRILIWLLYLVSLAIAAISLLSTPKATLEQRTGELLVTAGLVAGVASGHAWQRQGGRMFIAIVVILIMAIAVFVIPYVVANDLTVPRF